MTPGTISTGPQAETTTVRITGMTCSACERRVGKALSTVAGVEKVTVSSARARAVLTGTGLSQPAIRAAVERAGYRVGVPPWLLRDRRAWTTVVLALGVVVAVGALASRSGLRLPGADPTTATVSGGLLGSLGVALLVGLAAGVSTCMALVGGLVLGLSAGSSAADGDRRAVVRRHLTFQAGRLAGFAVGGALLGTVGSAARLPDPAVATLSLVAAVVMLLLGVRLTGLSPRISGWSPGLPGLSGRADGPVRLGHRGALLAGAATFLLPCGFTQAVQVYAISLGDPAMASATMTAFAVGTLPGLLGLGALGSASGWRDRSGAAVRVVGVVVLAFAVLVGTGGLRTLGLGWPHRTAPAAVPTEISSNVTLTGDVQVVRMTQSADGYSPSETVVRAGVPIRWTIDVTARFSCSSAIRVPSVSVKADFTSEGVQVVDVPALQVGTTPFSCAMGMYTGSFVAIPPPGDAARTP